MADVDHDSSQYLSFPDGDVVLRSSDAVEFRVDSVILRRASPLFADMFKLSTTQSSSIPLDMTEPAQVLDDVLRMLYPISRAPLVRTDPEILVILRAIERLQISTHAVTTIINTYLSQSDPPLRAWALAVRYDYPIARREAVRRFIAEKNDHLLDDVPELESVDARSVFRLLRIKREAVDAAHTAVSSDSFVWYCQHHTNITWRIGHRDVITSSPFDPAPTSEAVLQSIIKATGCPNCMRRCQHESTAGPRAAIRRMVGALLHSAGEVEARGGAVTDVAGLAIPQVPSPPGPMPPS